MQESVNVQPPISRMEVISLLVTVILIFILSVVIYLLICQIISNENICIGFAASLMAGLPTFHRYVHAYIDRERPEHKTYEIYPTKSPIILIIYGIAILNGIGISIPIISLGLSILILELGILDDIWIFFMYIAFSALTVGLVPTGLYLAGEWIGRSSPNRRMAWILALCASLLLPVYSWYTVINPVIETISSESGSSEAEINDGSGKDTINAESADSKDNEDIDDSGQQYTFMKVILISYIERFFPGGTTGFSTLLYIMICSHAIFFVVPSVIGALRGARYKTFFDLAFYSKNLSEERRLEIEDFILYLAKEEVISEE